MKQSDDFSIQIPRHTLLMIGAIILLLILTVWAYTNAKYRTPTVVLPGGITYLGPSPTGVPKAPPQEWGVQKGLVYPYSFSYPKSLSIGVFPGDPFDSITIFKEETNANENLLLRVENLDGSAKAYAENWWKQYSAWRGISSVTEFTNSNGLKGYKAKYLDGANQTPYDHVFLEIPNKPDRIIWMSGKMLDKQTFDKLVDSVSWEQ